LTEIEQAVFSCAHIEPGKCVWIYSADLEWLLNLYGEAVFDVDLGQWL